MGIFDSIKSILGISNGTSHNTSTVQISVSEPTEPLHRAEFIIQQKDEETLQRLVNKYVTPSIEEAYKDYGFRPSSNARKYSNKELRAKVEYMVFHFLDVCSGNKHWVRDSINPDSYFSNYTDLLVHLQILMEFEPYFPFRTPVPSSLYADYSSNREKYNSEFIKCWFESVTSKASSLKTLEGRKKRIEKNCSEIMLYRQFMTEDNIALINSLKENVEVDSISKSEKKLPEFDPETEAKLHEDLRASIGKPVQLHFSFIALQDFYYKYRDNDAEFLELCKQYCEKDIALIPQLDEAYIKENVDRILLLTTHQDSVTKRKYNEEIEQLRKNGFDARIPSFKRLSSIYERCNDFESALHYCDLEIKHYLAHGYAPNSDRITEINKRIDRLKNKEKKINSK